MPSQFVKFTARADFDRIVDYPVKRASAGYLPTLILSCFLAGSALAADGFDDGSFDGPAQTPGQDSTPTPAADGGGGFDDGSFDDGGSFEDTTPPPRRPERQAGGDGFDDGSFDDDSGDETRQPDQREASGSDAEAGGGDDFIDGGDFDRPEKSDDGQREPRQDDSEITELEPDRKPESGGDSLVDDVLPENTGVLAFETRDFGVPPTNKLRSSQFHAPTPTSIPGGRVVTTDQLAGAMQNNQQFLLIDVLGGQYVLPNALSAPGMAQPGNYRDRVQQQTNQWLNQITRGNGQAMIVIYCSDPHCWLSYNASLRAIAAGYPNVFWYRGGLQAWNMSGLPLASSGF